MKLWSIVQRLALPVFLAVAGWQFWIAHQREAEAQAREAAPATDWLVVKSIVVHPTLVGTSPVMSIEREIKQPFVGEWAATIRKATDKGFEIVCAAVGATDYLPDAKLPHPTTLDWWTFPVKCDLAVGLHRVDTTWTIKVTGYPEKFLTVRSNLFEVRARDP